VKKRLLIGLAASMFALGMAPGLASAAPNEANYGQCHQDGSVAGGWMQSGFGPWNVDQNIAFRGPFYGSVPFDQFRACPH
jgi:hypothetical protein